MNLTNEDHAAIDRYLVTLLSAVKAGEFEVEEARAELAHALSQAARDDPMFKALIRTNPLVDA